MLMLLQLVHGPAVCESTSDKAELAARRLARAGTLSDSAYGEKSHDECTVLVPKVASFSTEF
jgi:hypothetical protein